MVSAATYQKSLEFVGVENAPIWHIGPPLLGSDTVLSHAYGEFSPDSSVKLTNRFASVGEMFAFDSLRVIVNWAHPTDGLGNEDSTTFKIKATKQIKFSGGGTVAPDTWRYRRSFADRTADTFRVALPVGDSVLFNADSIRQCRGGKCSAPGTAAWGYQRTTAPPSMTFIKVQVDSF